MKKFIAAVVVVVGLGLALRYAFNRPAKPARKPAPVAVPVVEPPPRVTSSEPQPEPQPQPTPEPTRPPPPPAPPRFPNATRVSTAMEESFAVAGGVIYYCDGKSVMAEPISGGAPKVVGECDDAFELIADEQGVVYCSNNQLLQITTGIAGSHVLADNVECILAALDDKYVYFSKPGFEGVENPGVYRVARGGGTPERIHATRPKEQFMVFSEGDVLWISAWSAGTITKLPKAPGAKARTVVTAQKGIVDVAAGSSSLYWIVETSSELRRRKKPGGVIQVIGRGVDVETVRVVDDHVYWFERAQDEQRLMHLAPGAEVAEELATGLRMASPSLQVDSVGAYVSDLDGIYLFKR